MTALLAHELVTDKTQVDVPLAAIQQSGNSGLLAGEKLTAEKTQSTSTYFIFK